MTLQIKTWVLGLMIVLVSMFIYICISVIARMCIGVTKGLNEIVLVLDV